MTSQKQKMLAGELYTADDPELAADAARAAAWMERYNNSLPGRRPIAMRCCRRAGAGGGGGRGPAALPLRLWL